MPQSLAGRQSRAGAQRALGRRHVSLKQTGFQKENGSLSPLRGWRTIFVAGGKLFSGAERESAKLLHKVADIGDRKLMARWPIFWLECLGSRDRTSRSARFPWCRAAGEPCRPGNPPPGCRRPWRFRSGRGRSSAGTAPGGPTQDRPHHGRGFQKIAVAALERGVQLAHQAPPVDAGGRRPPAW